MFNMIILRLWREWRLMVVLLLGMCLVTGFLALGPLYVQAIAGADFDQRIASADDVFFMLEYRNDQPYATDISERTSTTMADYVTDIRTFFASTAFTCGFVYDWPLTATTTNTTKTQCYRPAAYPDLNNLFTPIDGRLPELLPDATRESLAQVEAVITPKMADKSGLTADSYIVIGEDYRTAVAVHIVGIVEPTLPASHPFWSGFSIFDTIRFHLGNDNYRFDVTFAVHPEAYHTWLADVVPETNYLMRADIDRGQLASTRITDLETRLDDISNQVRQLHPEVNITTWLTTIITHFQAGLAAAQGPITLLSFLILVLMLYNIYTIASLILEQQGEEWALFSSRGAGIIQLLWIQLITVSLLGIVAFIAGPLIAYAIVALLSFVGPQAHILNVARLGGIPSDAYTLSAVATVIAIVALTIPAINAALKSLLRLKQGLSRPPMQPAWARYFLDVIFLAVGFSFLLRLYSLSTDAGLDGLLSDPFALVRILLQTASADSLNDPFTLMIPALFLTGASLLWMRVFPYVMRLLGSLLAVGNGLTLRLAFWNIERDPAHYAQLVLLLIGTLALGTASLTLSHTRESGAWEAAQQEIGADAVVTVAANTFDHDFDWSSLPTVESAAQMLLVETGNRRNPDGALIGLNLTEALADDYRVLVEQPPLDLGGLLIPEDATQLQIDVYPTAPAGTTPISTVVAIELLDALGQVYIVEFTTDNPTNYEEYLTYTANLATVGTAPYRMVALQLRSLLGDSPVFEFEHVVYLDNLVAIAADGTQELLSGFEADTFSDWQWASEARLGQILSSTAITMADDLITQGANSLRVIYTMRRTGRDLRPVTIDYRVVPSPPLPVVVSAEFAEKTGLRSRFRRTLQIGDTMTTAFTVPVGDVASTTIQLNYTIVGIIDDFPSFTDPAPIVIADATLLRARLNTTATSASTIFGSLLYDFNRVWLDLAEREPSPELMAAVQTRPDYLSAEYAYVRYSEIQRDPLANSVTGILFAGFWVSLFLSLLDFGFYMSVTIQRRAVWFATLQAIGWNERDLLNLLTVEQAAFITPALFIGVLFGALLSYLILPFLALVGGVALQLPLGSVLVLVLVLVLAFTLILRFTARALRRMSVNEIMRFGE